MSLFRFKKPRLLDKIEAKAAKQIVKTPAPKSQKSKVEVNKPRQKRKK